MSIDRFSAFAKNKTAASMTAAMLLLSFSSAVNANDNNVHKANYQSVKSDYVTDCRSGNCAGTDAVGWTKQVENWDGVAVSVRMGTEPLASDQEIKDFISKGFEHFGVKNYKFFFEQNDVAISGISFHVRGGTSDLYTLADDLKPVVERYARQANNPNFAKKSTDELAVVSPRTEF